MHVRMDYAACYKHCTLQKICFRLVSNLESNNEHIPVTPKAMQTYQQQTLIGT